MQIVKPNMSNIHKPIGVGELYLQILSF